MPFIGAAIVGAIGLSGFVATATSALINLGVAAGLSYLSRSMLGATATTDTGIKTNIELGGNQPRGCIFGETGTAGQLIYWNTANENNNYLQMVFALGEGPHEDLTRIWVNGKERTLTLTASTAWSKTYRVSGFTTESGVPVLYVDFYHGYEDQPYDEDLVTWAKPTSRWTSADRLAGVCYAKVRGFYIDTAFDTGGVPTFLFGVKGRRLYDWRKDSTNGGSGTHRWSDAHTWEYSANSIVHLYNYQRGLYLGGELIVGMGVPPIDLRLDMYTAAANVCDTLVADPGGVMGPAFACNTVVSANEEYGSVIQRLLDSCAGSLYERVGAYGPIAGAAQSVIYPTITDGDLVVGRPVKFTAKLSRADLINGVFGSYVSPDDQYQMVSYPARTDSGAEAADTEIRRIQQDEPTITSSGMAQRLAQIRLNLARLQATATITLGFRAIVLEPGDWVRWNSARYGDRTYIILSLTQNTDQTVTVNLREIAASAFAWSAGDELPAGDPGIEGDTSGLATGVTGFSLSALTLTGAGGAKTPAIRVFWSPISDPTITAVVIEYRIAGTTDALSISTSSVGNGEYLISAGLVPDTAYELRAGIVTFPARATEWTGWSTISTAAQLAGGVVPNSITPAQMTAATRDLVVTLTQTALASLQASVAQLALIVADVDSAGDLNKLELARSLTIQLGAAVASFNEQIVAAVGPDSAIVAQITDLQAQVDGIGATLNVSFVTEATPAGALAAYRIRATAEDAAGGLLIVAKSGPGGVKYSEVWIDATRFLVTGTGADPTPVFLIDTSGPSPVIVLDGNVLAPDSITAGKLNVATLSAIVANLGEITAGLARSTDNRLRVDFDNAYVLVSS
ncbi:phage tail protein [Xanthobacter flavus]|uniref:phage tail protein n=1 Tax=Xanthobacter flavus TaxID=281 RepID=UPI003727EB45